MYLSTRSTWRGKKKLNKSSEFTTRTTGTGKEQEKHRQQQLSRASPTADQRAYPTAGIQSIPNRRDALRRKQVSTTEYFKEGKDGGASASHEPSEVREPRCDDTVRRSRSTQSSRQSPLQVATSMTTSRAKGRMSRLRRERTNLSSVSGSSCPEGHVSKENGRSASPIRITTVTSRGQRSDNTRGAGMTVLTYPGMRQGNRQLM